VRFGGIELLTGTVPVAGALVLHVLPAGPGRVAPFEVPNPTPCCAAHS
jgi:hypothetical protein